MPDGCYNACMARRVRFDTLAKEALREWPACSRGLWPPSTDGGAWLRAQPSDGESTGPRLVAAGSDAFRTQPDGLWLFIAKAEGFVDCVAIEACSSSQNFSDKRARYAPSTTSTLVVVPRNWLLGRVARGKGGQARWQRASGFADAPREALQLPVRFLRVLYFLEDKLYGAWRQSGVPWAHEYMASYSSIRSYSAPGMQSFLRRMALNRHFYSNR